MVVSPSLLFTKSKKDKHKAARGTSKKNTEKDLRFPITLIVNHASFFKFGYTKSRN